MIRGYITTVKDTVELLNEISTTNYCKVTQNELKQFFISLFKELFKEEEVKFLDEVEATYLLYNILKEIDVKEYKEITKNFFIFYPFGMILLRELELLFINGYDKIKNVKIEYDERDTLLLEILHRFYNSIEQRQLFTYGTLLKKLYDSLDEKELPQKDLIFIDTVLLNRLEIDIIRKLDNKWNLTFIFRTENGTSFIINELNIAIENKGERKPPLDMIKFVKSSNIHGEIFSLKKFLEEDKTSPSLIVVPMVESFFPIIEFILGEKGEDFFVDYIYPISRTPSFSLIKLLTNLFSTLYNDMLFSNDYIQLITHPYIKSLNLNGTFFSPIAYSIVDYISREELRYIPLEQLENNEEIVKSTIERLKEKRELSEKDITNSISFINALIFRNFMKASSLSDVIEALLELLNTILESSNTKYYTFTTPFLKKIINSLSRLKQMSVAEIKFDTIKNYLRFIQLYLEPLTISLSTSNQDKKIYVTSYFNIPNREFDRLFILDLNEGIIPKEREGYVFISDPLSKTLEIDKYNNHELLYRYQFFLLLNSANLIYLFYQENEKTEKSRFIEELIWQIEKGKGELDVVNPIEVTFNINFSVSSGIKEIKKREESLERLSKLHFTSYMLDTYIYCPLRFYYSYILNIKPTIEEIDLEIEKSKIGRFVHKVLELYFKELLGRELSQDCLKIERLENIIDRLREEEFYKERDLKVELSLSQIKKRLIQVIEYYREMLKDGEKFTILGIEEEFREDFTVDGKKITLSGRIDRIDKRDEKIILLDYKTGYNVKLPERDPWIDVEDPVIRIKNVPSVQLPFYILLYLLKNKLKSIEKLDASILTIGEASLKEMSLFEEYEPKDTLWNYFKELISYILKEILDLDTPFYMTPLPEKICPYCHYSTICGNQYIVR